MYIIDYHTHSCYSTDGTAKIEEMVQSAINKNINEIAITDHVEFDYPPVDYDPGVEIDFLTYSAEIRALAEKYRNDIRVVLGIETGLQLRAKEQTEAYFSGKDFDFVIGSAHVVDYKDLYDGSFFLGKTRNEAYTEYFEDVYNLVRGFDLYNVIGHLDSVVRYGNYPKEDLNYNDYSEIIDEILKLLIKKDKGIEINSSGFRYGFHASHPGLDILKRYKELGGEIVTTVSDAHRPSDVAHAFDKLYEMLKHAGFKAVTTFNKGKPVFVDIY